MSDTNEKENIVLGFDFGLKHIGVAVGQSVTRTAQPLTTIAAKHGIPRWEDVRQLVEMWQPDALVVGIPLNMDGTAQAMTHYAKKFAMELQRRYDLNVHTIDERLTTVEAKEQLFAKHGYRGLTKKGIDSLSAKLIVEEWLQNET